MAPGTEIAGEHRDQAVTPIVAITMGDPAGIGGEICVKAMGEGRVFEQCRPFILGDEGVLRAAAQSLRIRIDIRRIQAPEEGEYRQGVLNLIPITAIPLEELAMGHPQKLGGEAAYRYIEKGVELAMGGMIDALVTAPINKEALHMAGHPFPGHTELLGHLTGSRGAVMMLAGDKLRVSLVTTHLPLRGVPDALTQEGIARTIQVTVAALQGYWGITQPRVAVTGLNPHAGEGRVFGDEEAKVIAPAVLSCRSRGINVEGPLPADSLFFSAASGRYDAVVAMYHDQGLIPLKLLHFRDGVNITLGLPIIRTSVDHGTGYDIAGEGIADPTSLINAIIVAAQMAARKKAAL